MKHIIKSLGAAVRGDIEGDLEERCVCGHRRLTHVRGTDRCCSPALLGGGLCDCQHMVEVAEEPEAGDLLPDEWRASLAGQLEELLVHAARCNRKASEEDRIDLAVRSSR